MQWEFLGKQALRESVQPGKGHTYAPALWRTPVPGGWLVMTINSKSSDPQPLLTFYPDADHLWKVTDDPQAAVLLRPASGGMLPAGKELLRASLEEAVGDDLE